MSRPNGIAAQSWGIKCNPYKILGTPRDQSKPVTTFNSKPKGNQNNKLLHGP